MAVLVLFPVDFVIFWGFGGGEVQAGFVYLGVMFGDVFPCGCLFFFDGKRITSLYFKK